MRGIAESELISHARRSQKYLFTGKVETRTILLLLEQVATQPTEKNSLVSDDPAVSTC